MKFGDVPADVFLVRVAEQLELGLVRAKNDAFTADEVQTHCTIIEEVLELLALAPQVGFNRHQRFRIRGLASGERKGLYIGHRATSGQRGGPAASGPSI
jgi:hypothetical protein